MFTFDLTEEERLIPKHRTPLCAGAALPHPRDHELARAVPPARVDDFHALGLDGVGVPSSAGGQELGAFAKVPVLEEPATLDPGTPLALHQLGRATHPFTERDHHGQGDGHRRGH